MGGKVWERLIQLGDPGSFAAGQTYTVMLPQDPWAAFLTQGTLLFCGSMLVLSSENLWGAYHFHFHNSLQCKN